MKNKISLRSFLFVSFSPQWLPCVGCLLARELWVPRLSAGVLRASRPSWCDPPKQCGAAGHHFHSHHAPCLCLFRGYLSSRYDSLFCPASIPMPPSLLFLCYQQFLNSGYRQLANSTLCALVSSRLSHLLLPPVPVLCQHLPYCLQCWPRSFRARKDFFFFSNQWLLLDSDNETVTSGKYHVTCP